MTPSCNWALFYHGDLVLRASGGRERERESCITFYALASEAKWHHYTCILLTRGKSLRLVHSQCKGIRLHIFLERMSKI